MSVDLIHEIRVVKKVPGEEFPEKTIPKAKRKLVSAEGNLVGAPMPLLLRNFPHKRWYTANSEDISGLDTYGTFVNKGEPVVITVHGGIDGDGILSADIIQTALDMHNAEKGGLNEVYAAVLSDVYPGKDVVADLLKGGLPDSGEISVLSYVQLQAEGAPEGYRRFAVVRPLSLAQQTESGYHETSRLVDSQGNVIDSQVITYAGGVIPGQKLMDKVRNDLKWSNFGVWHPFNSDNYDAKQAQGRVLFLGDYGVDSGLFGSGDLLSSYCACFVGVAPEALSDERPLEQSIVPASLEDRIPTIRVGQTFNFEGRTYNIREE